MFRKATMYRTILLLIAIAVVSGLAKAQSCVDYGERSFSCHGVGCDETLSLSTCTFGCVLGTCNPDGNSTSCCGNRVDYAQIFTDGGTCPGINCGLARIRRAEMRAKKSSSVAGVKSLAPWMDLPPRQLFVPNRCTHEYEVVYELEFPLFEKEGV